MSDGKVIAETPWNIQKMYDKRADEIRKKTRDWWQDHILSEAPEDPLRRSLFFEELALQAFESLSEREHLHDEGSDLLERYLEAWRTSRPKS